jgi:hypothetical protein
MPYFYQFGGASERYRVGARMQCQRGDLEQGAGRDVVNNLSNLSA